MDRTDRKILEVLQQEGRISNVALAEKVNLTPTPCLERVRRLEREGYIDQYVALLNAEKLGQHLLAYMSITLTNTATKHLRKFNERMRLLPEVQECQMVAGGFDYLIKVRVSDMKNFHEFLGDKLATIPEISQSHTYFVIEEVKSETGLNF